MAQNILVIGGVALGPKAAARCKRLDPEANITLIDQDEYISYGGCGIPYYVSGEVANLDGLRSTVAHVVRDPKFFDEVKGVKVRTKVQALKINRDKKTVLVKDLNSQKEEELSYDKLVLGLGAKPRPLTVPGAELTGVTAVTNLHEASFVHEYCAGGKVKNAVVIGGGFIGLEVAVALADMWGINVTIVEVADQILPTVSNQHSARIAEKDLRDLGVNIVLSEKVTELKGENGKVQYVVTDKQTIEADLVIASIGFLPNTDIAKEAGLEVIGNNAILVDKFMRTSDPNIYAGGDCCSVKNIITKKDGYLPLGSLANRQGRIIGSNLAALSGREDTFDGYVGTWAVKLNELSFVGVGLTLAFAQREGFDAVNVIAEGTDHAHFFPEASPTTLEIVVERKTRRILGFQGSSPDGDSVKARVDAVAMLMQFGNPTLDNLSNAEIAYAPPFASAMDIINGIANVADNVVDGRLDKLNPSEFFDLWKNHDSNKVFFVDARPPHDHVVALQKAYPNSWVNIPLEELNARINEIPKDRPLALVCSSGTRSYETLLVLKKHGYTNFAGSVLGGTQTLAKADLVIK